jgi:hypothetical protein
MNQRNCGSEPKGAPEGRTTGTSASMSRLVFAALLAAAAPAALAAQSTPTRPSSLAQPAPAALSRIDSLRMSLRLPPPPVGLISTRKRGNSPGTTMGSPSAFGARYGDVFLGAGYQQRTRYTNIRDGSVVGGFGLGNPIHKVGLEIALTSYSTVRSGFGSTGGVSFKVHRILPRLVGVAVGVENAFDWGRADGGRSLYAVGSKVIWLGDPNRRLANSLALSAGIGNGRFLSEPDALAKKHKINLFGSASLRVAGPVSVGADWTGQNLNVGLSAVPLHSVPIAISVGFADVLSNYAGDGARFIMGIGYGVDFTHRVASSGASEKDRRNDDR